MTARIVFGVLLVLLLPGPPAGAQRPASTPPLAAAYVDRANGLSLEQAIARALEQEPSLRGARSQVDVAQGIRLQASLRPNPSLSFERREEPGGRSLFDHCRVENRCRRRYLPSGLAIWW